MQDHQSHLTAARKHVSLPADNDWHCPSSHSVGNRISREIWTVVWFLFFRPTPRWCHAWRRFLLRVFGARIGKGAAIHASVRVWAPWNLEMGKNSCLGQFVDCYCVDKVTLGDRSTISQYVFLCSATHDHTQIPMPLVTSPITVGSDAWVCAGAFIGPGVVIGEGAIVGARGVAVRDVEAWTIVAGNPARKVASRYMQGRD